MTPDLVGLIKEASRAVAKGVLYASVALSPATSYATINNLPTPELFRIKTHTYEIDDTIMKEVQEFDEGGRITKITWTQDWNKDGKDLSIKCWEFNTRGQQTKFVWDKDADGTPEYIEVFKYEPKGKVTEEIYHLKENGELDINSIRKYDASGDIIEETIEWFE
ncbi:hypothetical protein HYX14_00945 [Candidatus Woesearchaeota archaeon]|nr:hypothetical protein [Candidatus Woesearchaeota archaeon]